MTTEPKAPAEPDYAPDEAAVLLAEIQLQHLAELRELGMDLARVTLTRKIQGRDEQGCDLAYSRISKTIQQIIALEQYTIGMRDKGRQLLRTRRLAQKKEEVSREVGVALQAAQPKLDRVRQENLLRDVFRSYDFSDPREVATIVAGICRSLGVPPRPEIWPEGPEAKNSEPPVAGPAKEPAAAVKESAPPVKEPASPERPPPLEPPVARVSRSESAIGKLMRTSAAPVAAAMPQLKIRSVGRGPP